ncbi:pectate lyase, partial [Zopfochytrium polystomum]
FPAAAGTRSCTAPINVAAGATFDGGMFRYDRGAGFRPPNDCLDAEAGAADTIFILADGATLQNVVIGQEVFDAVYCTGSCKLKNVWFERTCEDSTRRLATTCTMSWTGGAISGFKDKGVQHNGAGTVFLSDIDAFWTTQGKGKLYRSCGGCGFPQRNVVMTNVRGHGVPGEALAGVNADKGDTATLSGVSLPAAFDGDFHVCEMFPTKVDGINNANCKYTDASITFA